MKLGNTKSEKTKDDIFKLWLICRDSRNEVITNSLSNHVLVLINHNISRKLFKLNEIRN